MLKKLETSVWQERIKSSWTFLLVLFLAVLFFPLRGAVVSPDSTLYMAVAANLNQGLGYVDASWSPISIRGPIFSALIALSFRLFDQSVESALYVVRLFFVGNLLVIYWFGQQLKGRYAGLLAAILVLTSYVIHYWSARVHLDNVMPFFILLSNLILFIAIKKERFLYYALAGFILGIGFLVKDVAGLFALVPLLLWIVFKPFRTRKNILSIVTYGVAFSSLALTWLIYAILNDDSNYFINWLDWIFTLGFQPEAAGNISASITESTAVTSTSNDLISILAIPLTILERFHQYYKIYFTESFALAPLFVAAWAYILYRALRYRHLAEVYLMLLFVLFLPIMLFLGNSGFRAGQTVYTYLLSYLVLAYALIQFPLPFLQTINYRWALAVLIFLCQLFLDPSAFLNLFRGYNSYGYVTEARTYTFDFWVPNSFHATGWDTPTIRQAGEWLNQNAQAEEPILADWQWLDAYYFYAGGRQPVHDIEYLTSGTVKTADVEKAAPIRFIWTQGSTDPSKPLSNLLAFSEPHFLSQVKETDAKYIIFGQQRSFLALYLRTHQDFIQVAEFDNGLIQIFEVVTNAALEEVDEFPLFASNRIKPYLGNLKAQRGLNRYNGFKQNYFTDELLLDKKTIAQLETGTIPIFPHNGIISHKEYATLIQQVESESLIQAINRYERQVIYSPDNLWNQLSLAYLYQTNGQNALATPSLTIAFALAEENPLAYSALARMYKDFRDQPDLDYLLRDQLVASFKSYLNKNPNDIQSYWQLAEIYQLLEDWNGALHTYEQALELWPESAGTVMRMARVYQAQEQFAEAKSAYSMLLTLEPDDAAILDPADIHIEIGKILLAQAQGATQ